MLDRKFIKITAALLLILDVGGENKFSSSLPQSLEALKKELMELTVAKKNELDEKDRQLQEEISQLRQQHQLELTELTKLSEQVGEFSIGCCKAI